MQIEFFIGGWRVETRIYWATSYTKVVLALRVLSFFNGNKDYFHIETRNIDYFCIDWFSLNNILFWLSVS